MVVSFHSHSGEFCRHAKGNLEEVVLEAVAQGFRTFGLTEHMPRFRTKDLYPEESDLTPADLERIFADYVREARRLQREFAGRIELLVGMETEYINAESLSKSLALKDEYKLDYLVGSVHHVLEIPIDFDEPTLVLAEELCASEARDCPHGATEEVFRVYFDAQYEMLKALRPAVVAHFDLIRLYRPKHTISEAVWERIRRNVAFIVSYGGLFEVNTSAWRKGLPYAYPQRDILEHILSQDGKITLSDDSHGPLQVGLNYHRLVPYFSEVGASKIHVSLDGDKTVGPDELTSWVEKRGKPTQQQ